MQTETSLHFADAERSNMLMLRVMTWISLRLGRTVARCSGTF